MVMRRGAPVTAAAASYQACNAHMLSDHQDHEAIDCIEVV